MRHGITSASREIAYIASLPCPYIERAFYVTYTRPGCAYRGDRVCAECAEDAARMTRRDFPDAVNIKVRPIVPITYDEGYEAFALGELHGDASPEAVRGFEAAQAVAMGRWA